MRYILPLLLSYCAYAADPTPGLGPVPGVIASSAAITGGTIDNTVIGGTTPASGTFSNVVTGAGGSVVGGFYQVISLAAAVSGNSNPTITGTSGGGSYPFNTARGLYFQNGNTGTAGGPYYFAIGNGSGAINFVGQIGGVAPAANTFGGSALMARNNAAADTAGAIGQTIAGTGTSTYTNYATTASYQQIDTISLTAGKWHIYGHGTFSSNASTLTVSTNNIWVISTVTASATGAVEGSGNIIYIPEAILTGLSQKESGMLDMIVNISATTSYFLNSQATFTVGSPQFTGSLEADRMP